MKNKTIAILSGLLAISICLNAYTIWRIYTANKQVAVFSTQVIVADESIAELNNQLSQYEDLENQISDLQAQLNQSSDKITNLEESLQTSEAERADLETKISDLETQISDKEAVIAGLEAQHQSSTVTTNTTTQQIHQPTTGAMPGGTMGDITWTTGGDGSVANGHFGHYE